MTTFSHHAQYLYTIQGTWPLPALLGQKNYILRAHAESWSLIELGDGKH